jgi:hypothetical protein
MNRVMLQKNGDLVGDPPQTATGPLAYLSFGVALSADYSLRSFFQMIEKNPPLADLNMFFPDYLEQARNCPGENCNSGAYEYLEFGKTVEMIGFPGEPRLEIYHWLKGVCRGETIELKSSQLETLLDVPLRLGKLKHVVFGDKVDVFEFDTVFALFDFIDGIAWELSFHNRPEACEIRR